MRRRKSSTDNELRWCNGRVPAALVALRHLDLEFYPILMNAHQRIALSPEPTSRSWETLHLADRGIGTLIEALTLCNNDEENLFQNMWQLCAEGREVTKLPHLCYFNHCITYLLLEGV